MNNPPLCHPSVLPNFYCAKIITEAKLISLRQIQLDEL